MAHSSFALSPNYGDEDLALGRAAKSPAQIPTRGWKQVALRSWKESIKDNIGLVAAGVSFYGFLALVPLLGATVLTYGLIAAPATVLQNVKSLAAIMPADAAKLVGEQLMGVVRTAGDKKGLGLLLAIAIALFGARNAAGSVITALNIAYEEEEKRGLIKVNLLALAITAGAVVLAILAMVAVAALGNLQKLLPHLPGALLMLGKLASYLLLLAGAAGAAATLYRYGPDRQKAKWVWITPGSVFASVGWIVLTLGFGFYAANFGSYGKTYGSLATVVVLLTWMYLSAYVLLFGAELNSELEHQTAQDTTTGVPLDMGHRGAWLADHVARDDDGKNLGVECAHGLPIEAATTAERASPNPIDHPYFASRLGAHFAALIGGAKVGMLGSATATIGLSMIRRKGRSRLGLALLGSAVVLALLQPKDRH